MIPAIYRCKRALEYRSAIAGAAAATDWMGAEGGQARWAGPGLIRPFRKPAPEHSVEVPVGDSPGADAHSSMAVAESGRHGGEMACVRRAHWDLFGHFADPHRSTAVEIPVAE